MQFRGLVLFLVVVGCGSSAKKQGELGADCYPNGTCNVTLTCVGGLCVASTADAAVDALDAPVDAPIDAHADARPDAPADAPPDASCDSTNVPDGHHNAGQTCLAAGCHLIGQTGAGAPEYSYAGTLWRDAAGSMPYPGATITIVASAQTHRIVTATNGNFFIPVALAAPPTSAAPAMVSASGCGGDVAMTGALVDNGGNCNNCHRTGGTTTPIHLP